MNEQTAVTLIMKAIDQLSPVVRGAQPSIDGLKAKLDTAAAAAAQVDPKMAAAAASTQRAGSAASEASGHFGGLGRAVTGAANVLSKIGLVGLGIDTVTRAARGAADALGLGLNVEAENVRAQFQAMLKDNVAVEKTLALIRQEASTTPFAFQEMATAAASLMPASKQSNIALMDLIKTAEVLAASNPAEGLKGAAFAIREALSGDFVSVVERFNLPRQRLNELKAQGVPALQAISIAMKEMGLDADLVSGLANTATGRWSTLMDTFDGLKLKLSQPIFERLSGGLANLQAFLDANQEGLSRAAVAVGAFAGAVVDRGVAVVQAITPALVMLKDTVAALVSGEGFDVLYDKLVKGFGPEIAAAIAAVVDPLARFRVEVLPGIVDGFNNLVAQAPKVLEFFQQNQIAADAMTAAMGAGLVVKIGAMTAAFAASIPVLYAQAAAATAAATATLAAAAPFVAVGAVIGAVILAGIEVVRNWELIRFSAETMARLVVLRFSELKDGAANAFNAVLDAARTGIGNAVAFIGERIAAVPGVFRAGFEAARAGVSAAIGGIFAFMTQTIPFWVGFVRGWLQGLPGVVLTAWDAAKDAIISTLGAAWEWVSTEVPTWPGKIGNFVGFVGMEVYARFEKARLAVVDTLRLAWEWVTENVPTWPGKIGNFVTTVGKEMLGKFNQGKDAVTGALGDAWKWVTENVPTWPGKIGDFLKDTAATIGRVLSGVTEALSKPFRDAWEFIQGVLGNIASAESAGAQAGAESAERAKGKFKAQSIRVGPQPLPLAFDRDRAVQDAQMAADAAKLNFKTSSEWNEILKWESLTQQKMAELALNAKRAAERAANMADVLKASAEARQAAANELRKAKLKEHYAAISRAQLGQLLAQFTTTGNLRLPLGEVLRMGEFAGFTPAKLRDLLGKAGIPDFFLPMGFRQRALSEDFVGVFHHGGTATREGFAYVQKGEVMTPAPDMKDVVTVLTAILGAIQNNRPVIDRQALSEAVSYDIGQQARVQSLLGAI